jgi:O-acetyl-ADP-ribose deacetylase (regulator of RNase III)
MIGFHPGLNIFDSHADVLVNAVNRVGVMGGGIAKAFKDRYPLMYQDYRAFCERQMNDHEDWVLHKWQGDERGPIIANLATKDHWKNDSELSLIHEGMLQLVDFVVHKAITTKKSLRVAVPKLGCGLGNLEWDMVRPVIVADITTHAPDPYPYTVIWMILGEE